VAAEKLDPQSITDVIIGSTKTRCSCPNGPGRSCCHQKFSFNQVRQLRGNWWTCADPVPVEVARLTFPANTDPNAKRTTYYLGQILVCRKFYQASLGIEKRLCTTLSALVRGKALPVIPAPLSPTHSTSPTLYQFCVAFWKTFFRILLLRMVKNCISRLICLCSRFTTTCSGHIGRTCKGFEKYQGRSPPGR